MYQNLGDAVSLIRKNQKSKSLLLENIFSSVIDWADCHGIRVLSIAIAFELLAKVEVQLLS